MEHDLVRIIRSIVGITFAPIITDGICENITGAIETGRSNRPPHGRVTFQTMFRVFIPEMKRAVGARCRESAVDGVEGDGVDGVDV